MLSGCLHGCKTNHVITVAFGAMVAAISLSTMKPVGVQEIEEDDQKKGLSGDRSSTSEEEVLIDKLGLNVASTWHTQATRVISCESLISFMHSAQDVTR
jgi:hypothetical protein